MTSPLARAQQRILAIDEIYRARPVRERVIVGAGIAALVFMLIDAWAIQPLTAELEQVDLAIERTEAAVTALEAQTNALQSEEPTEEEKRFLDRKNHLLKQIRHVDAQINSQIADLVPPRAIVAVLEEILAPIDSLQLVRLQSQPPEKLGSGQGHHGETPLLGSTQQLYRHVVKIEIEGDFAATLEFLERAEKSDWNLLWERLDYRVDEYPTATISIDIHTISDQEAWIGV